MTQSRGFPHLNDMLDVILPRETHGRWFATPVPALNGRTPLQAINDGDYDSVVLVVASYSDPSYS